MTIQDLIKQRREQQIGDYDKASIRIKGLIDEVKECLYQHREVLALVTEEKHERLRTVGLKYLDEFSVHKYGDLMLQPNDKNRLLDEILQEIFGLGRLDAYLKDPDITEIMVNGTHGIFVERDGQLKKQYDEKGDPICFKSHDELLHVIDKIVAPINRKVDQSQPIVDARLADGSRVNIVIPPAALDGPTITIRKFPKEPMTMTSLIAKGSLPIEVAQYLKTLVEQRYNIIVSGGTGSGKTTFLNALSASVDQNHRVITIEDSAELQIQQVENLIRLETRPPNIEGRGEITMRDLVKTALRMRPDRIIVGEVRGAEALDMLQAMNTGHDGSLTTAHANSAVDLLFRLETMVLMAGVDLPLKAIRQQIASAVDIIVQLTKLATGERIVKEIIEVVHLDQNDYQTNTLYAYQTQQLNSLQLANNGKLR